MIVFKLTSKDDSKNYYSFSAVGLSGIIVIDRNTSKTNFAKIDGCLKDDEKEKAMLLYIAQKKIKAMNFPEQCVYATH